MAYNELRLLGINGTTLGVAYEFFVFKYVLCRGSPSLSKTEKAVWNKSAEWNEWAQARGGNWPLESSKKGYDCLVGSFVIQITATWTIMSNHQMGSHPTSVRTYLWSQVHAAPKPTTTVLFHTLIISAKQSHECRKKENAETHWREPQIIIM